MSVAVGERVCTTLEPPTCGVAGVDPFEVTPPQVREEGGIYLTIDGKGNGLCVPDKYVKVETTIILPEGTLRFTGFNPQEVKNLKNGANLYPVDGHEGPGFTVSLDPQ